MALNHYGTMALNLRLDSAKVVNELMALCHEKSQILIITNKDFFLLCFNGTQI